MPVDQSPPYVPLDAVAVVLTADFDCTIQFKTQSYGRAIYVGGAGDVKVQLISGNTVTFKAVTGGQAQMIFGAFTKIFSTTNGTTATNLVLLQ